MRIASLALIGALTALAPEVARAQPAPHPSQPVAAPAQPAPPAAQPAPAPPVLVPYAVPAPPPAEAPRRRSTGMMVAGIVLTSIASAALIAGVVSSVAIAREGGEFGGLAFIVIGLPLLGGSLIFAGVGIPLWVVGASPAKPQEARAIPTLALGPGSAALRVRF